MFVTNRHSEFEVNTVKHIRLLFYIEGPDNKGTVHVEAKQVVYRSFTNSALLQCFQIIYTFIKTNSNTYKVESA